MTDQKYMHEGLEFARNKLIEECGELIAALGKTGRWGWASFNPELTEGEREINRDWVMREMEDVRGAINNLERQMP